MLTLHSGSQLSCQEIVLCTATCKELYTISDVRKSSQVSLSLILNRNSPHYTDIVDPLLFRNLSGSSFESSTTNTVTSKLQYHKRCKLNS
jgi:Cdc6-like AAA superfamily ATPase